MTTETLEDKIFALKQYDELLKIKPDDADFWAGKAQALQDLYDLFHANPAGTAEIIAKDIFDGFSDWTYPMPKKRLLTNLQARISNCYYRALDLRPNYLPTIEEKIKFHKQFDEKEKAIDFCDEVIKKHPNEAWAWYLKGFALMQFGEHKEANLCFRESVKNRPDEETLGRLKENYVQFFSVDAALFVYGIFAGLGALVGGGVATGYNLFKTYRGSIDICAREVAGRCVERLTEPVGFNYSQFDFSTRRL